jgi:hypothetical protein
MTGIKTFLEAPMKHFSFVFIFSLSMIFSGLCLAQNNETSYYVSSNGNDSNNGLSEETAFKTLSKAVIAILAQEYILSGITDNVNKITIIGTLNTPETRSDSPYVFLLSTIGITQEIVISGKRGSTGSERAILSGAGTKRGVLVITTANVRFENIEISGGEDRGFGIWVTGGSTLTLGAGAVVRNNQKQGILINERSTVVLDGGEIRENKWSGIIVGPGEGSMFIMRHGFIRNNYSPTHGGGVFVLDGGTFTMTGGSIINNSAEGVGGGVIVRKEGRFDQTGGVINNKELLNNNLRNYKLIQNIIPAFKWSKRGQGN